MMHFEILDDILFNCPAEKVQFSHGGNEGLDTRKAEHDTFATTKGIEQFFTVGLQLTLVTHVDHEFLAT